jgi:hypothetical protein
MTKFDLHRLVIESTEHANPYFIQIGIDSSGTDALANGNVTDLVFVAPSVNGEATTLQIITRRKAAGTPAYVRCMAPSKNTSYVTFYYGIHEYIA